MADREKVNHIFLKYHIAPFQKVAKISIQILIHIFLFLDGVYISHKEPIFHRHGTTID